MWSQQQAIYILLLYLKIICVFAFQLFKKNPFSYDAATTRLKHCRINNFALKKQWYIHNNVSSSRTKMSSCNIFAVRLWYVSSFSRLLSNIMTLKNNICFKQIILKFAAYISYIHKLLHNTNTWPNRQKNLLVNLGVISFTRGQLFNDKSKFF